MDLDCVAASPGSRWVDESASRRRQRRLSSPSLRAYLTPAFDAVAAGEGGVSGSPASSLSSGGLELGFDASLLRYRRACFSASTDPDRRRLLYSPPPPQARVVYPVAGIDLPVAGGCIYGSKLQDFKDRGSFIAPWRSSVDINTAAARCTFSSIKSPADLQSAEGTILATKAELSTPKPEATPSAQATSAQPQPTGEEDDLITEVLYGRSGRRRLPIFKDICPE